MPTYESNARFQRDWKTLSDQQRRAFLVAVMQLTADLRAGVPPRRGLRVKKMQGHEDVWEMSWAPDGRATFSYGDSIHEGEVHVVWRRIGSNAIFTRP